ncbi:E3 ubiquitin-protein ligase BRE1B-like [Dendronephthya gigantea]|uniref:E3 ubiquitin-protein ligase BRE1B-like n=1 Tax=Dendronephthya gigantea TaxID=151771 RepID=UPI00106D2034|nr:E3 ubiquitin-protein ligase BRE1B-like [Dendronephthya gigantea]
MKRAKKDDDEQATGEPSNKKTFMAIPPVNVGPVSTEEEMDIQVLRFQNKKLGERLEEMKVEEENLKIQIEEYKKRERDNTELLSVIHRAWNQMEEETRLLVERFEQPTSEENQDLVLDEMTSISFIKHLKQVTPAEREDELTKKISASRDIIAKLLELVKNAEKNNKDLVQQLNEEGSVEEVTRETMNKLIKESENLQKLVASLQEQHSTNSLEFAELRNKYAMAQDELSEKNTSLQEAEYDLQKRNHRVERLLKRLSEVEKQCKTLPAGTTVEKSVKGEQPLNTGEAIKMQSDYEEQKLLAEQRLVELEKLTENYKGSLEEIEKHKMEALQIPESVVLQSAPYRTLQSQYSVIFNELNLARQQLEEIRRIANNSRTQHILQLEQLENESLAVQKKFQAEIARVEDALMQVRRDYELLRMKYEHYLKTNEQTGPMIKEMDNIIKSLQNSNRQLKVEIGRFKTKLAKEEEETKRLHAELENIISGKKPVVDTPVAEETTADATGSAPTEEEKTGEKENQEDGELPTESDELKALKSELKQSQESQKEMKVMLDVYKGASKDNREKLEMLTNEKRLKSEIEELHAKIAEGKQEIEKCKAAMADELALKRLKAANETIEMLQRKIAATKQEEDALLSEMEFTGQAFEEMQEQNIRVLQELREKEEANLKLMSERIKGDQIQKQLKEEKDVMADQITALNSHIDAQEQVIKKLEERERSLQSTLLSIDKELVLRQQAMDLHKRKATESAQTAQDFKIRIESFQQQLQEAEKSLRTKTRSLEEEIFRSRRMQEEISSFKRKLEKQKKMDVYGTADEILLEEIKEYKARLTCPCCNTRQKDAILTKCYHIFCFECLKTRYDTRQRKCPKCNATFGNNDFKKVYL